MLEVRSASNRHRTGVAVRLFPIPGAVHRWGPLVPSFDAAGQGLEFPMARVARRGPSETIPVAGWREPWALPGRPEELQFLPAAVLPTAQAGPSTVLVTLACEPDKAGQNVNSRFGRGQANSRLSLRLVQGCKRVFIRLRRAPPGRIPYNLTGPWSTVPAHR